MYIRLQFVNTFFEKIMRQTNQLKRMPLPPKLSHILKKNDDRIASTAVMTKEACITRLRYKLAQNVKT
jgi:hypothetical protein